MTWTGAGVLPCLDELERDLPYLGGQERDPPYPRGGWVRVLPCLDSCLDGQDWGLPWGDQDLALVPCLDSGLPCPGESLVPWECCLGVRMAPLVLGHLMEFLDWIHDEDCLILVQLVWSFQKMILALVRLVPLDPPVP